VILLDVFEDQLDLGKISTMGEVEALLGAQLKSLNRQVLRGGRSVKSAQAKPPKRRRALEQHQMKMLLATVLSTALLAVSAHAQTQEGGAAPLSEKGAIPGPYTNGAGPSNNPVPSGERTAPPNTPREYGETNSGRRVNPDRVPPLSPGGQGLRPEGR
jgi:hypothetical protein